MSNEYVYMHTGFSKNGQRFSKIGKTKKLRGRMREYMKEMPWLLEQIWTRQVPDCDVVEQVLKAEFARKQVNREWFELTEQDLAMWGQRDEGTWQCDTIRIPTTPRPSIPTKRKPPAQTVFLIVGMSQAGERFHYINVALDFMKGATKYVRNLPWPVEKAWSVELPDPSSAALDLYHRFNTRHTNGCWFQLTPEEEIYIKSLTVTDFMNGFPLSP